ncbi:MAG: hypothetical protein ACOC9W_04740, partial [Persicimonas sp.]
MRGGDLAAHRARVDRRSCAPVGKRRRLVPGRLIGRLFGRLVRGGLVRGRLVRLLFGRFLFGRLDRGGLVRGRLICARLLFCALCRCVFLRTPGFVRCSGWAGITSAASA